MCLFLILSLTFFKGEEIVKPQVFRGRPPRGLVAEPTLGGADKKNVLKKRLQHIFKTIYDYQVRNI